MTPEAAAKSPLYSVYLHRLYALAIEVRDGCDAIFHVAHLPGQDARYMTVDPSLHARIDGVLIAAANIKRLIATSSLKGKSESTKVYNLRVARSEALAALLAGVDVSTILDVRLRNSMEHFDEYLDELNASLVDGKTPPSSMAAYNMTFSHYDMTEPQAHPLRLYIATERRYYNFKTVVDLDLLRTQAAAVSDAIAKVLGSPSAIGGLIIPMAQRTK